MPVYLIQCGESGPVKIGHAGNPAQRLRDLQCAHHETLRILRLWDGGASEEGRLHQHFSAFRIRNEWFRFDPSMLTVDVPEERVRSPSRVSRFKEPCDEGVRFPRTAGEVIARLGGVSDVAECCHVPPNSVTHWRIRGSIPLQYRDDLLRLARHKGCDEITSDLLISLVAYRGRVPARRMSAAA